VPILDAPHDFAHPVETDQAWSESYYFNGYDPVSDTGLFTRIGIRPNEGTMDVALALWLPDMEIGNVRAVREQRTMVDDDLVVGGVRYERVAPMAEWRLTCDCEAEISDLAGRRASRTGAVAMDLTFRALTPAVGTDGQGRPPAEGAAAATAASVGRGHLEQAGAWSGWIEVDGRRSELSSGARGNRDKSWGPRRWGGPLMWRWFSINVGDDTHFGGIRIGTAAGDLHRGWVWTDGEATSIREWDVTTELAADGVTHQVSHVVATDKRGRRHRLRGDLLRVYGVPHRTGERDTVVLEGLARWEYDGRVGYGIAEYLHQLDGDGRPLVAID
jgi:hypothetical protein